MRKNTFCIHKKIQGGQAESFENVALHLFLFYFPEFLMRTDFCWCAAHFNSALEFGSSTWEPIEMQREARSGSRIPLPAFTGEEEQM